MLYGGGVRVRPPGAGRGGVPIYDGWSPTCTCCGNSDRATGRWPMVPVTAIQACLGMRNEPMWWWDLP